MKKNLNKILNNLILSFSNEDGGFSARKLSAFAAIVIAYLLSLKYSDNTNIVEINLSWLAFALLCLGIVTIEQIIKFKNGKEEEKNEE